MPSAEEIFSRTRVPPLGPLAYPSGPSRPLAFSRSPLWAFVLSRRLRCAPPCSRCASGGLIPAGGTPGPGRIGLGWASRFFLSYSPAIAVMGVVALAEGGADWRRGLRARGERARGPEGERARREGEKARRREARSGSCLGRWQTKWEGQVGRAGRQPKGAEGGQRERNQRTLRPARPVRLDY